MLEKQGKWDLEKMKSIASEIGWECVSDQWRGDHTRYRFKCARGHEFFRPARGLFHITLLHACTMCKLEDVQASLQETVAKRGGTLLNGPVTDLRKRYRLRCRQGHEWVTGGREIIDGCWCTACAHIDSTGVCPEKGAVVDVEAIHGARNRSRTGTPYGGGF